MEQDSSFELKVGLFVLAGLLLFVSVFIVLGAKENMFERNLTFHARYKDIAGLRAGAAVRLAGLDVGSVTQIEFPQNIASREVWVHMRVAERFADRVRGDTIATIASQGLLGDKYIALSLGTAARQPLEDGGWLESVNPVDLFEGIGEIKNQISSILGKVDDILGSEGGQSAGKSILGILSSVRNILAEVEEGRGIIHSLVYDPRPANDLKAALASLKTTIGGIDTLITDVRTGDGSLHDLIYDQRFANQVSDMLADLGKASRTIDELVTEVKTGDGLVHDLVYGNETGDLLNNLEKASGDIKDLIAAVKNGEGTLGALMTDPSVYGDVKTLLGGAQRNKILKSFVRDTIRKNERREGLSDGGARE